MNLHSGKNIIVPRTKRLHLIILKEVKNEDLRRRMLYTKINGGYIGFSVLLEESRGFLTRGVSFKN